VKGGRAQVGRRGVLRNLEWFEQGKLNEGGNTGVEGGKHG
jgi:hypothetical protein